MKKLMIIGLMVVISTIKLQAQNNWHVAVNGTPTGNGTLASPWDLQTALSHPASVLPGDTIWLHGGTYTGHFISKLNGTASAYITVRGVKNQGLVELDGNINTISNPIFKPAVLNVTGAYTTYRDFEITCKGNFERYDYGQSTFRSISGIDHTNGVNCKFINLVIYNNPGSGFGSWKATDGTEIYGNVIYNNGYYNINNSTLGGRGNGFYVQNSSDTERRLIKNNVVFNTFKANVTIWSACQDGASCVATTGTSYVKNVDLIDNTVFNSSSPVSTNYNDETINNIKGAKNFMNINVSTDDNDALNIAKNINILGNISYFDHKINHYLTFTNNGNPVNTYNNINHETQPLVLGYNNNAQIENVIVKNNVFVGKSHATDLRYVKTIEFKNNLLFGKYLFASYGYSNPNMNSQNWKLDNNLYFLNTSLYNKAYNNTVQSTGFKYNTNNSISLQQWQTNLGFDMNSKVYDLVDLSIDNNIQLNVIKINQNQYEPNRFHATIMNKKGGLDTSLDFSRYNIPNGTSFQIRDVENYHTVLRSGTISNSNITITVADMDNPAFEKANNFADPSHDRARKSYNNFGVFQIEFFPVCPATLTLQNQTLTNTQNYQTSGLLTLGTGYINETTANVTTQSATQVVFKPNTHIKAGSKLHAKISPCETPSLPYVGDAPFDPTAPQNNGGTASNARKVENYVMKREYFEEQIYPNPANDKITITTPKSFTQIAIYDLNGKLVTQDSFSSTRAKDIDLTNLPSGTYLISISYEDATVSTKTFIKK